MADPDKTEKPTPKKLRDAVKDGNIARTPEFGQWGSLFVLTLVIGPLLKYEATQLEQVMQGALRAISNPDPKIAIHLLRADMQKALISLVALGTIVMVIGVGATAAQGGIHLNSKAFKPDFKKFNPVQGIKKTFGPQALWTGLKTLLKSALLFGIAYSAVRSIMPIIGGGLMPMSDVLDTLSTHAVSLMRTVAEVGLLLAAIDYVVARRRRLKGLRMSKKEIKDENKQSEGDPKVKGAIRSRQLANARRRMISDVAEADVLLVNPTHVAVALKYDPALGAPRVIARGAGAIAARIRAVASEADVPLIQDVPLARALYRSCNVGQEIPRELFAAVATVLAFVISRRNHGHTGGQHETPRLLDEVLPDVPLASQRRRHDARRAAADAAESSPETSDRSATSGTPGPGDRSAAEQLLDDE